MSLFETPKQENTFTPFAVKQPMDIYALFKAGKDCTKMFIEDNVPTQDSEIVQEEIKRLEEEILSKMSGTFVIGTVNTYPNGEDNEEVIENVYFKVSTKANLLASMTSISILDKSIVLDDCIAYNPSYDPTRTWKQFVDSFKPITE